MRRGLTAAVALLVLGVAGDAQAATWRQPQPARSADGIEMVGPRARYTADGALVAAWSARDYGANWVERDGWAPIPRAPLRVAVRAPGREAFGAARTLDANASAQVGLATDAVGGTVLAWVGGDRKLRVSRRPPGGAFGPVREIATAFSVALAMNRRGDAALAYIGSGDAPWISHAPPGGDFGEPVRAGTVGTVTSHTTPGVGVAGDGRAVVAWQDESDGLVARAAVRAPGGPVGAPMRLSPPGRQGQSPRVAVDDAGRAMVVWTDGDRPFTGGWVTAAHMRGSCCFSAPARVGMGATWFGSQITPIEGSGALIWTDTLPPGSPAVAGADMGSGGLTPVVGFPRQGGARLAANARGDAVLAAGAEGGGLSLGRRAPGAGFGPSQRVVCEPSPWGRNASVWPDVVAVSPGGAASVFFSISRPGGDASLLIEDHSRGAPAPECPAVKRTRTSRGRLALQARMPRGGRLVRGRWLGLRASCGVACRVRATGRLKIAGRRKRIPFTATTARRPRAGTISLRVGLTRSRAKVVRRALARRRVVRARVQVRATGGGSSRTLTFRVRLRRR